MSEERVATAIGSFDWRSARERVADFRTWQENPAAFEGKETLKAEEYQAIKKRLLAEFRERVTDSSLHTGRDFSESDLGLVHGILETIAVVEKKIIPDEERRPWSSISLEHSLQTELVAKTIAEQINIKKPEANLELIKIRIKALIHDIGRFASHHPIIHGLAGREFLKELGFHPGLRRTVLAHLESGIGPYMIGIDQESWPKISHSPGKLKKILTSLPLDDIIVVLADVAKKPKEESPAGDWSRQIVDPVEGARAACQTKSWRGKEDAQMRTGFVQVLKEFVEGEYQVSFDGEGGIVALAQSGSKNLPS